MSLREPSKKLSTAIQRWVNEFLDSPDEEGLLNNHKLFEELHSLFQKGYNFNGISEVCLFITRNLTSFKNSKEMFIYSLIPIIIESYVIHGILSDSKHDQLQSKQESSISSKTEAVKAFSCIESFIWCLIGDYKSDNFTSSTSKLGLYSCLFTDVPLNRFYNTDRKLVNTTEEMDVMMERSPLKVISTLIDVYIVFFIDKLDLISEKNFPYDSTKQILCFFAKIFSFSERFYAMHSPKILQKTIEFIDLFLTKLSHQKETQDICDLRRKSMEVLVNIEMMATYYCYADVLLVCNAIKSLCIKKYGEICLTDDKNFTSRPVSAWRMSTIEESGILSEIDQLNYSEDMETGYKMNKAKNLSSAVTNASFKPEILPEDISVE